MSLCFRHHLLILFRKVYRHSKNAVLMATHQQNAHVQSMGGSLVTTDNVVGKLKHTY